MAATLDLTQYTTVWDESFDNGGTGMLTRTWGPGLDTSVAGQITISSTPDNQDSGAMVPPWGPADSGYGYGLYSFTLSMGQGDAPGPYALLWPGTDVWPGPELDLVELLPGGTPYSTIHWKGADGSNQFQSYYMDGIDVKQTHTYSLNWEAGRLTGYVDGVEMWTTTEHVPADYAHGGENSAPGIGMQTWWSTDAQHGSGYDNTITLYDVKYAVPNSSYDGGTVTDPGDPVNPIITQTIGSGADSLVLKISQDAWQGSAQYTIAVDGKQIGGTLTAGASHGAGDDSITVKGNFAAGAHKLTVTFVNDAYGGSASADRNLHVDGISFNGTALAAGTADLKSNGGVDFGFTKAAVVDGGASTTAGDAAPAAKFGFAPNYGKTAWEGHTTFDGADYHTFGATGAWNDTPAVLMAPTSWTAGFASKLAFDNFVRADIDLHAAGSQALDVMLVSAKRGAVTLGDGSDHLTWVAHSNASGATANTMAIKTGAGDDVVKVTAAGLSSLADYDRTDNGSLYNGSYDGRYSVADVTFGSGKDSVTVEGMAKLVLHAGSGAATAVGGGGSDQFIAGTGMGNFTGGAGKDTFVFNAHDGHAVIQDFTAGTDKLKFTGLTSADIHTKTATEGGVSGLLVTYDTAGDSVFLAHATKLAAADMLFA
ncbi:glycosyl hydrolase family protein [Dankookia rubra]|uniref:Glycosyl hydrolase family protein n=1 Tax=Dankookia rubra TaxID=1442381 RepID=A0A4R5QF38_9PROT|nr:carbohydrate-binding domain-containing protein [Dankookia rubra]TDH61852.1 glycosyl hydrolase family protein [Dankookia rubra]